MRITVMGWAYPIYPYVKSTAVYKCPDDTFVPTGTATTCSYSSNLYLTGFNGTANPWPCRNGKQSDGRIFDRGVGGDLRTRN